MVLLWQAIEGGLSRIPKVLKKYPSASMGLDINLELIGLGGRSWAGLGWVSLAATLSVWSKVLKIGTHIRHLENSHWAQYYRDWPDGGAIETVQSCKLWKAVSQAPYVAQTWNFAQMCLSSQWTDLPQEPISSAYLDFPPFWILWKTPKSLLLLQKLINLHAIWYT